MASRVWAIGRHLKVGHRPACLPGHGTVRDGPVGVLAAVSPEWYYRLDLFGPSSNVDHPVLCPVPRRCCTSGIPSTANSPVASRSIAHRMGQHVSARLQAEAERSLGDEMAGGPLAQIADPFLHDGGDGGDEDALADAEAGHWHLARPGIAARDGRRGLGRWSICCPP